MTGSLADYYHWEETGKGIRIYMHAATVDRLQAEVLRSASEVGGILLGRIEDDRGQPVTVIHDFVPVPCAYRGGPQYALSGDDAVHLEAALLRIALAGCESPHAPSILGYYRSHMREGLSLSPDDLLLIESYFQTTASVFMLVKAVAGTAACTAGFFFWEDGQIQPEFSPLEVALGRTPDRDIAGGSPKLTDMIDDSVHDDLPGDLNDDLPADLADLFRKAALPDPAIAPATEPVPSSPPPPAVADPPAHSSKTGRAWQGVLVRAATISIAAAALVISVITYLGAPRPPRGEASVSMPAATLGLRVERNPPDLLVSWNRNAREIAAARHASLSIRDGGAQRTVDLDSAHLARGSYLYTPAGDDLQFRLEVFGADEGSVAQSIRVLTVR